MGYMRSVKQAEVTELGRWTEFCRMQKHAVACSRASGLDYQMEGRRAPAENDEGDPYHLSILSFWRAGPINR